MHVGFAGESPKIRPQSPYSLARVFSIGDIMLQEGDVIEIKEGHRIYARVPKHFVYTDSKGCFGLVNHDITVEGELSYFAGKYIVIRAGYEGGGCGHGPGDKYPDGYKVHCIKADDESEEISFYQDGCFTAMIENIEPIGRATLRWTMEGE